MQGPQAQWCQHHGWCRHDTAQCWGAVGKGGKGLGSPAPFPRTRSEQVCMYCGSKEHSRYQCPKAKDSGYTCFNCGQVGHQVKDCPQAFNKTLVDQNSRAFWQAITNGAQFVPVQLNVVAKSTKSFNVIGKETWKPVQTKELTQSIPFPSSMVVEKNILTFEFESPAQARDAFAELKKQGLQLEGDLEPVQALVPLANTDSIKKMNILEEEVKTLKDTLVDVQATQKSTQMLLKELIAELGLNKKKKTGEVDVDDEVKKQDGDVNMPQAAQTRSATEAGLETPTRSAGKTAKK